MPPPAFARAALILSALALLAATPCRAEEIDWRHDYNVARREAADRDRLLVLDFGTENCFWCQRLDEATFRQAEVAAAVNRQFIALKVDAGTNPTLVQDLHIKGFPTVLLASPNGMILDRIEGFLDPAAFLVRLGMTRDYQEAGKAVAGSDYAQAVKLLKNVLKDGKGLTNTSPDGKEPASLQKARLLLEDLEQQASGRLERAREQAERGQRGEATQAVKDVIRLFAGTRAAEDGARLLTALADPPGAKEGERERQARDLLAQARDDYRAQRYVECLNRCEVLTSRYAELPEGGEAKRLTAEIKDNPERLRQAVDGLAEQLGGLSLAMAEAYLRKGQPQQAILCLERVIQTLPNTRQAEEAQVRLSQIQGQPVTHPVDFRRD